MTAATSRAQRQRPVSMVRHPFPKMLADWLAMRDARRASRTKMGMSGYAMLCAIVRDKPCTARALQERAHLGHTAAYRFLSSMHAMKRVHITAWTDTPGIPALAIYAWGPGEDAPRPGKRANGRKATAARTPKRQLCSGVVAFVSLLRAMEVPSGYGELAEATGLHFETVVNAVRALVSLNLARLSMWMDLPQGGAPVAHFEIGPGPNARKPARDAAGVRRLRQERQTSMRRAKKLRPLVALPGMGAAYIEEPRA